jgi:hypothetical protein
MFTSDEPVAALLRESTALKDAGHWPDAVARLYSAKALMLLSPVSYPVETWCKLPLYLQQAGLFAESMAEFQFLLDDLPRRAKKEARLDEPYTGPIASARNEHLHKSLLRNDAKTIQTKRDLAEKREERAKKNRPTNTFTITAEEVFGSLYAWFQANTWFTKIDINIADLTQESAAQQAVLTLRDQQDVFHRLPIGVQGLAARFIYSFMAELRMSMLAKTWVISGPNSERPGENQLVWLVIAQEILSTNPLRPRPH